MGVTVLSWVIAGTAYVGPGAETVPMAPPFAFALWFVVLPWLTGTTPGKRVLLLRLVACRRSTEEPAARPSSLLKRATTKIHVAAEGRCRPLSLLITPGQRADCTQFEPVMDKIRVPRAGRGRPRRTPDSVGADKAYSNRKIRSYLRKRGIRYVIPEKKDHKAARLRRGSRGGRPRPSTKRDTKRATRWRGPPES